MKQYWKDKWLEALRSGKYQEGRGSLRDGDLFCCLGVLCDVVIKDDSIPAQEKIVLNISWQKYLSPLGNVFNGKYTCAGNGNYLPPVIQKITGIEDDPELKLPEHMNFDLEVPVCLSTINDEYLDSFSEIADLIEKQIPGVE